MLRSERPWRLCRALQPPVAAAAARAEGAGGTQKLAEHPPLLELAALHRRRPEDEGAAGRSPRSRRRRGSRSTTRRTSTRTPSTSGRSRARSPAASRSTADIIVLTDNERYLALMIDKGWVEPLDKDVIVNINEPRRTSRSIRGSIPTASTTLPWQSGMTGIAYNAKLTKPILSIDQLLEDKALKGQGHGPERLRGHARPRHARQRRRPEQGHRRDLQECTRPREGGFGLRADPPVHGQRLRGPAQEGRPAGAPSPGPGTSSSSRPTTRT